MLKLIKKIVAENKQTVVMVTHDNNLASYGDMIIHIKDGKITEIEQNRQVNEDLDNVELGGTLDIPSEMSDEAALSAQPAEIQPVYAEQDTASDQAISEGKQAIENVTVPSYEGYHPRTSGNDPGSA